MFAELGGKGPNVFGKKLPIPDIVCSMQLRETKVGLRYSNSQIERKI